MPETRRLQTSAARKGRSFSKETAARRQYERRGPGLHTPSINTDRGAYGCGKLKGAKPESKGKPTCTHPAKAGEVRSLKGLGVTAVKTRNRAI